MRHERSPQNEEINQSPVLNKKGEFAKLRRKVRAMQREGVRPPGESINRLLELDGWLALNYQGWVRNFPQARVEKNRSSRQQEVKDSLL